MHNCGQTVPCRSSAPHAWQASPFALSQNADYGGDTQSFVIGGQYGRRELKALKEAASRRGFRVPEKAILSAHKQFTLLHKSIDTKATCLAENFR
jgi:hypothetical protein